jgi:ABC-type cobalamin/Fe3+-siderophores transport system ATPase subunit
MAEQINNIFINGSTWLRADFHLHTKADKTFDYVNGDNDFVKLYIDQLINKNINIGIITNHNKFDKGEFNALKKKALLNNIGLYAGVEFSLKEGIHILIIFDDKWYKDGNDKINDFLISAFLGKNNFNLPPYPNSNFDIGETVKALNVFGLEYFIVLAHVDETNGLFSVLKGRTLEAFIQDESFSKVLAIQKSGNLDNYKKLCSYANRNIACVEGSDNAEGGIEAIGIGRATFIKIGAFNFEALEYSLIDEYRICQKIKPENKNSFIKSVQFEGGLLDSKILHLSPDLNNIIGIRGSGKSSLLEIIRYTLNIPLGKVMDREYKNSLIEFVLKSGGKVVIKVVNQYGEEYRIEKIYGQKEDIYDKGNNRKDVTIDAIFKIPVYFGQKDLSNKDIDFEADLINKLIGSKLLNVKSKIESKKVEVINVITEIKKLHNLKEIRTETETIIKNAEHQLKLYKEKGVEDKLKQQSLFDSDLTKINDTYRNIEEYLNNLNNLIVNYNGFFSLKLPESTVNKDLMEEANSIILKLNDEFNKLKQVKDNIEKLRIQFKDVIKRIFEKQEGLKEEFARIKREIDIPSLNPDNFLKLNRQVETSKLKLKEIEKSENRKEELKKTLSDKLTELNSLFLEEFRILELEVKRINETESKLEIEIKFKDRRDKFLSELRQIFKGTGIRDSAYQSIELAYKDFIEIFRNSKQLADILNESNLAEFKKRFNDNLSDLLTYQVENRFVIKYDGKPLKDHSLGQRASALILFLLAQHENDILIIDQPEDDLDNQTIYEEVIKEIKHLKGQMQFIFATHNANIPVLGDSEKIIACKYIVDKDIDLHSGTIDNHDTQEQIVNIMEGGKEAFRRRKNIYSIWKLEK